TVIGDGDVDISGVAAIEEAQPGEITFISNPKYLSMLSVTKASAVIVSPNVTQRDKPLLSVANPYLAFAKILTLYTQKAYQPKGIDPQAWISPTARIGKEVTVYPFVCVGDGCSIGDQVTLYPGVSVGKDSSIGDGSILHAHVSIYPGTIIGKRVILHSGVVVGSDGFGYVKDGKKNVKIPQVGHVEIEDDVEIGANTTVDRATLGKTLIHRGVKIDNLVMVAHNVVIGEDSIIVAQVGISGSTKIGSNVTLAGQAGLTGHITVGDNVMVGAQSGVMNDLPPNSAYTGTPAIPHREQLRVASATLKLPEMRKTLKEIEARLKRIEEMTSSKGKEE
ncbi:MAG: UDP-3-O-(3-hydroxymyristoyl)glucosamine N-acyltransferase, partial [Deltaproteobacteria bacterium RBG_13_52_11b]